MPYRCSALIFRASGVPTPPASDEPVHEVCDVFGSEDLTGLALLFITVEFVEKNPHDVFASPPVAIDAVGYLANPVDEVIYGSLLFRGIHANIRIHVQQDPDLSILLAVFFQRFCQYGVDTGMKRIPPETLDPRQIGSVSLRDQGTGRKDHSMVQIFDPKLRVEAVIDAPCEFVYPVFIDEVVQKKADVVFF